MDWTIATGLEWTCDLKILLFGKNGQMGRELVKKLPSLGQVTAIGREECDLTDRDWLRAIVRLHGPHIIVNAAAYTAVDRAEREPELARAVNTLAPEVLAEEAMKLGARLVHYSTSFVFDGVKREPYTEEDKPYPLNVYGETKLLGEQKIQDIGAPALILRTSWVYGKGEHNFVAKVLQWAATQPELRIVADQISRPTWSVRIAQVTVEILRQCLEAGDFPETYRSVIHLASTGAASRYTWAKAILSHVALDPPPRLVPVVTAEIPSTVIRPRYSVLDCTKLEERFGVRLPVWRADLSLALSAGHVPAPATVKYKIT